MNARIDKDRKTLEAIGRIYCSGNHAQPEKDSAGLCPRCRETVEATLQRTVVCPYGHEGNCQDCSIHCQRGEAQERIRQMMRYAAPRMTFRHPLMTLEYLRKKRHAT
ncbi:MAG: nitrous oxide-stimulated promoter family protein [Eggerthellaceae bacterium]|nr:nitrous oxide-stimulated promoter family protein [Eggerthellaceae bacterium]